MNLTDKQKDYMPYFVMLDLLQESGQVNMMEAPRALRDEFNINKRESIDIASEWIKSKTVGGNDDS
tara:strand:+ start:100 stop:297 length:198 start_codon:yes stop_codon:yes gene_type:complete